MSSTTSLPVDGLGNLGTTASAAAALPASMSTSQIPSSSAAAAVTTQPTKTKLVPTNTVALKDGTVVRVRIEATLPVEDVVRQLLINLRIKDTPAHYALRDENDELVTSENLRKKIKGKTNLK